MADTNTFYYYNDNWQVLCEYSGGGSIERMYMYGNYIDEPVMTYSGGVYFYVQDHLYSTAALVDASGTPQERYEYDAYGQVHILDANFADDADGVSDCGNPYMFTGRRVDFLDGGKLTLQINRHRYYDYYTGRWLTQDPLGTWVGQGRKENRIDPVSQYLNGLSLYLYVWSNPFIYLDPSGLYGGTVVWEGTLRHFFPPPGGLTWPAPEPSDLWRYVDYKIEMDWRCTGECELNAWHGAPVVTEFNYRSEGVNLPDSWSWSFGILSVTTTNTFVAEATAEASSCESGAPGNKMKVTVVGTWKQIKQSSWGISLPIPYVPWPGVGGPGAGFGGSTVEETIETVTHTVEFDCCCEEWSSEDEF